MSRVEWLPEICKSQVDLMHFLDWLEVHVEIQQVQGWKVLRFEENSKPYAFQYGSTQSQSHFAVFPWLWQERHVINDWIRGYRQRMDA